MEMRRENLTVVTVKYGEIEKAKDIALQAWNINSHGTYVNLKFSTYNDTVTVKYFEDDSSNIKSVVASWGEIDDEDTEKESALVFDERDFKPNKAINEAFDWQYINGYNGDVTFIEEK